MSKSHATGQKSAGTTDASTTETDHIPDAGTLVYERIEEYRRHLDDTVLVERVLVDVRNIEDRDALADELAARGHDRGAAVHLEGYEA